MKIINLGKADGCLILFILLADDGKTWQVIATMIDALLYEVDSTTLPGSDTALIRVLVSDGGNTGQDDSDATFSVAFKAPVIEILAPTFGQKFNSSQSIDLAGLAWDTSGQPWPEDSLLWSSGSGIVGQGSSLSINLEEGVHPIALLAMEGLAIVAFEAIEITVSNEPGNISIVSSSYVVNEKDGLVTIGVERSGAASGAASVLYYTRDDTAISGGSEMTGENDYVSIAEDIAHRLEWGNGETGLRYFNVTIKQDVVAEGPERFKVLLKATDGEILGTDSATVTIISDFTDIIFIDGFE